MSTLVQLAYILVILVIALVVKLFSKEREALCSLILVIFGMGLRYFNVSGYSLAHLDFDIVHSVSIIALAIIVFRETSILKILHLDKYEKHSLSLSLVLLFLDAIILSIIFDIFTGSGNMIVCLMLSFVMAGFESALIDKKTVRSGKIKEIISFSSVFIMPLIIMFVFVLYEMVAFDQQNILSLYPILIRILMGIGTGFFIGLIVFRFMKKYYHEHLSLAALLISVIGSYLLAEFLGGNGIFACMALGFIFSHIRLKNKEAMHEYSILLSGFLDMIIFLMVGLYLPFRIDMILISLAVFLISLLIRFIAVSLSCRNLGFSLKEQLFLSFQAPKGAAIGALCLYLYHSTIQRDISLGLIETIPFIGLHGASSFLNIILLSIVFSNALSLLFTRFSGAFIKRR